MTIKDILCKAFAGEYDPVSGSTLRNDLIKVFLDEGVDLSIATSCVDTVLQRCGGSAVDIIAIASEGLDTIKAALAQAGRATDL